MGTNNSQSREFSAVIVARLIVQIWRKTSAKQCAADNLSFHTTEESISLIDTICPCNIQWHNITHTYIFINSIYNSRSTRAQPFTYLNGSERH